jgi:PAS domain S-box-containing protein
MSFSREDLQRSIDSTASPAFITGDTGRIDGWNSAAEILLGYSRSDVIERRCHRVVRGQDMFGNSVCQLDCPVKRRVRGGQAVRRFPMFARAKAGHYLEVECSTLCIRNEEGDGGIIHLLQSSPDGHRRLRVRGLGRAPKPGTTKLDELTQRETEVLRLLASGLGTSALARELSISAATVRSHIENIFQKLDVHSRLEAVVVALRSGVI